MVFGKNLLLLSFVEPGLYMVEGQLYESLRYSFTPELDVFDCAFPDWTRATYALTPSKTITPRAINHGLKRLIPL